MSSRLVMLRVTQFSDKSDKDRLRWLGRESGPVFCDLISARSRGAKYFSEFDSSKPDDYSPLFAQLECRHSLSPDP